MTELLIALRDSLKKRIAEVDKELAEKRLKLGDKDKGDHGRNSQSSETLQSWTDRSH